MAQSSGKSGFKLRGLSFKKEKKDNGLKRSKSQKSSHEISSRLSVPDSTICEAIRPFDAILPCDLSFVAGDKITIITRTEKQFDWWEGKLKGKTGIFPANYVRVLKQSEAF